MRHGAYWRGEISVDFRALVAFWRQTYSLCGLYDIKKQLVCGELFYEMLIFS